MPFGKPHRDQPNQQTDFFVVSRNLHCRHLTTGQKAVVAIEAEALVARLTEEARERQLTQAERGQEGGRGNTKTLSQTFDGGFSAVPTAEHVISPFPVETLVAPAKDKNAGRVTQQLAETFGTNRTYVNDVKKIKETAPETLEAIKTNEVTVPDARILAKLPKPEWAQAKTRVATGQARSIKLLL